MNARLLSVLAAAGLAVAANAQHEPTAEAPFEDAPRAAVEIPVDGALDSPLIHDQTSVEGGDLPTCDPAGGPPQHSC